MYAVSWDTGLFPVNSEHGIPAKIVKASNLGVLMLRIKVFKCEIVDGQSAWRRVSPEDERRYKHRAKRRERE